MTYETFEIVINDITVAYCAIDKANKQFGYVPVEDETLSTVLKYLVEEPVLSLTMSVDDSLQLQNVKPGDELFLTALGHHLPRKYHISNVQEQQSDRDMRSFLNYLLKGEYIEEVS